MTEAYEKSAVDGYENWDRHDAERRHVSNHIKMCRKANAVPYFVIKLSGQEPRNYELIELAMFLWVVKAVGSKTTEFIFKNAIESVELRGYLPKQDSQKESDEVQP